MWLKISSPFSVLRVVNSFSKVLWTTEVQQETISKVVDTVPVHVGMYCTGTYTGIEMPTFRTGLNTNRIGHTG